jgi:hypothetical protein
MSYTPCCLVVLILKTNVAALGGPSAAHSRINLLNFKSFQPCRQAHGNRVVWQALRWYVFIYFTHTMTLTAPGVISNGCHAQHAPPQRTHEREIWHWNREGLVPSLVGVAMMRRETWHENREGLVPLPFRGCDMASHSHVASTPSLAGVAMMKREIWHENREGLVPLPHLVLEQGGLVPPLIP